MEALSVSFHVDGAAADPRLLGRMQGAAAHRGPQQAEHVRGPVGMGLRRGPGSLDEPQPLADPGLGLSLVLSGRLYNAAEVRAALTAAGRPAGDETHGGTILAAYRAWGPACLERLDGDFAFALHDEASGRMLCACDAIGVKPLHFAFDGRRFLAATEPKQLLAAGVSTAPCEEKIAAYLSLAPHLGGGRRSFFRDIERLRPGHWLCVGPGGLEQGRHWSIDPERRIEERTPEAMAGRVRRLMSEAVGRRVPSRGPYGCALSGGFDSSSIAALYRLELSSRGVEDPLSTFSFMLGSDDADEAPIIAEVARAVRSDHHSVQLDRADAFAALPEIIRAMDAPIVDMGVMLLWWKKSLAARQGVPTLLSGLGGDELFMGRMHFLADLLRAGRLRTLAREILACRPVDPTTSKPASLVELFKNFALLPLVPRPLKKRVKELLGKERPVGLWIRGDLARRVDLAARVRTPSPRVFSDRYRQDCWEVFRHSLVGEALPIHESVGGAFGVDTRFPLMDRRLVEYMFAVPREQKVRLGRARVLQRAAMDGLLPEVVIREHLKKDFHPVLARQQRANFERALGQLRGGELLSAAYVDWDHLNARQAEYLARGAKGWFPLLYAMSLEWWLRGLAGSAPAEGGGP